jgi:hypothetical protein
VTKGLVRLAEDPGSLAKDLYGLTEDPLALPQDPWLSAANLVLPSTIPFLFEHDLCALAEVHCRHAKALSPLVEDLCGLSEGLSSFTECGCRNSEVLCSLAMVLCLLAKDLFQRSEDLVRLTKGPHQEAEDRVSLAQSLREKTKDLYRKPKGVSSLAAEICPSSRLLVERTTILFRLNKGHSVFQVRCRALKKGFRAWQRRFGSSPRIPSSSRSGFVGTKRRVGNETRPSAAALSTRGPAPGTRSGEKNDGGR